MHGSKLNQRAAGAYSSNFANIILDDFFSEKEGISGQEIISLTSIRQVNFFVLKVLFEQWQEETKKFKSPFFNYRNSEVNQALKNLVNILSKHILIQKEDFRPLLEQAVRDTLYLLYDPENFYLKQTEKLSKSKDIRSIGKYIKLFKPLYEDIVNESASGTEKLETAISNAMISAKSNEEEQQATIKAFNEILVLNILSEGTVESKIKKEESQEVVAKGFESFKEPEANINGYDAPLGDDIKKEFKPLDKDSSNVNDQFATSSEKNIKTLNEQFEQREVKNTIAETVERKGESGLATSISINQRYMFLSDLFQGNEGDYHAALKAIEKNSSFDDSVEYLVQNFSRKYEWDMNSDEVKEFLKVIFKWFR